MSYADYEDAGVKVSHDGREMNFEADCLEGGRLRGSTIFASHEPVLNLICFDLWPPENPWGPKSEFSGPTPSELIRSGVGGEKLSHAYELMQRCFDRLERDQTILERGRELGRKLQAGFELTHRCPANRFDFDGIEEIADLLIQTGYDMTKAPSGTTTSIACGYNYDAHAYFELHFSCESATTCHDQGARRFPDDCETFERESPGSPLFVLKMPDCIERRSYRFGGDVADMRLIPIAPKVWIQVGERSGRRMYYGIVLSE